MGPMSRLVGRQLTRHPIRSVLTVGSLTVAIFLLCLLRSLVTTLEAGVDAADSRRLWVMSSVSLFADLPLNYQRKIEQVEGVANTCKWQWFGGYYQDRSNWFAQFACDEKRLLEMWPELEIIEGNADDFLRNKTACVIGEGLARQFGWKVGDRVPLIGALFPRSDYSVWEFDIAAIYRPKKATLDEQTMFFHWDYFAETQRASEGRDPNVGVYALEMHDPAAASSIMATIDSMFENGPMRVRTTTEAEFTRQFVEMVGNVPRLVAWIGTGVLLAILLAVINTMLMAGREQIREIGILKALGFTDGTSARVLLGQSLFLCGIGGGLGIGVAKLTEGFIARSIARMFPGYHVVGSTVALAAVVTIILGVLAGLVPAWNASRLRPVEALRRS